MLVKALMIPITELESVNPGDSLRMALEKMNDNNFLSIPVINEGVFKGVISKERIFKEYFEIGGDKDFFLDTNKVRDFTRIDIPHLDAQASIEDAAFTLEINGIPFVVITNSLNEFQGIITHNIIFKEFSEILGLDRGKKLTLITYDIPGQISKIADIIKRHGGDIISLVVMDPKVKTDVREIVVRLRTENFEGIVNAAKDAGFRVQ